MVEAVKNAVIGGKLRKIEAIVQEALEDGASATEILDSMSAAMDEIGIRFQANEMYVPEMLVGAKTMQRGVGVIRPLLGSQETGKYGKFAIGTVSGDLHDIGKNLVAMMVESAGFEVIDLGVDVTPEQFVETVRANPDCRIIGLSALLTTTMDSMRDTVKALERAGLRSQVKVMVGGAPITQSYADEIGADAYTPDAAAAAAKARDLVG